MDIEELLCAGSDILEDVVQAINTNNYSDLGQKIRDRVKEATLTVTPADHKQKTSRPRTGYTQNRGSETARGQNAGPRAGNVSAQNAGPRTGNTSAQSAGPRTGNTSGRNAGPQSGNAYGQNAGSRTGYMSGRGSTAQSAAPRQPVYTLRGTGPKSRFLLRRLGKSGMTLQSVLGGIGIFFFGLQSLLCLVALFGTSGVNTVFSVIGLLIFGGLTLSCSMLLRGGLRGGKLIDRYYAYGGLLGDAEYASVPDLAAKTGLKPEEVRKDLQAMISNGYLP